MRHMESERNFSTLTPSFIRSLQRISTTSSIALLRLYALTISSSYFSSTIAYYLFSKYSIGSCCVTQIDPKCLTRSCIKWITKHCPERRLALNKNDVDKRRAPSNEIAKCGTVERNYQPCTSKSIANKLFKACCDLYVPEECHFMCTYETDQSKTRNMHYRNHPSLHLEA
uniref:DB domain-containing protein n=1 Tax=Heterorhabditis bacteriophora TaxID=37862 RepID=A0A1I7WLL8_HETBA